MSWRTRRPREVRYSLGWISLKAEPRVFASLPLPGGGILRVMDMRVHMAGLARAARRLSELRRRSGQRGDP